MFGNKFEQISEDKNRGMLEAPLTRLFCVKKNTKYGMQGWSKLKYIFVVQNLKTRHVRPKLSKYHSALISKKKYQPARNKGYMYN